MLTGGRINYEQQKNENPFYEMVFRQIIRSGVVVYHDCYKSWWELKK